MKKKYNYLIILLYSLLLIFLLIGTNHIYGSNTDWINQHSVIPNYFRNIFYETGRLIPNFAFNLGGGQNIFNYSYYGLMSPIILISYLLPFISMTKYIIITSVILYISSGLLIFKYLDNHGFDNKLPLVSSLAFLTLAPITFHFHHHIMFVWYLPFLIIALMGVDKFIKNDKSLLLIISILMIILTNYYYSISCLFLIALYGIYNLIKYYKNVSDLIYKILKASVTAIAPILMSCFILAPTAFSIINSEREGNVKTSLISLLKIDFSQIGYVAFSMGLTFLLLLTPFILLSKKKIKKEDIFLSISLIAITYIPIFMYALNGFLYVRGKILIPFTILYIIAFAISMKCIDEINYKKLSIFGILLLAFILITNFNNKLIPVLLIDSLITFVSIYLYKKYNKKSIIYIPFLLLLIVEAFINNNSENYVTRLQLKNSLDNEKTSILKKINDKSFYRTDDLIESSLNANKNYSNNYNNTSIYSSNYNNYYRDFYNKFNNIGFRNNLIQAGNNNVLFNYIMNVKYLLSDYNPGYGYKLVKKEKNFSLYENDDVFDFVYTTDYIGSIDQYQKLTFPYNMEYLFNYPVANTKKNVDYKTNIKKLDSESSYSFTLNKEKNYKYKINSNSHFVIIKFNMDYNQGCNLNDQSIVINNIKNKLTCKSWIYHNKNNTFEYVISSNDLINDLDITIAPGTYKLSNVSIYTYDFNVTKKHKVNNLKIDKKNSFISYDVNLDSSEYAITSILYDKNLKVYVDNSLINSEIVNESFLGFKMNKGKHNVIIKYTSPGYFLGIITSVFGLLLTIGIVIFEKYKKLFMKLLNKYKELILYLIFGVLTTVISLVIYFLLIKTILSSNNAIQLQIANIISWIVAVLFAYVTNSKFVFNGKLSIKEMIKFYSSRLSTLFLDMAIMFIFVSLLHLNNNVIKIVDQFAVIVINYIISKFLVFKGGK